MRRINNITFNAGLRVRQVQGVDMGRLLRHGLPRHAMTIHTSLTFFRPVQVKMVKLIVTNVGSNVTENLN